MDSVATCLVVVRGCDEDNWAIVRDVICTSWPYFSEEDIYDGLPEEQGEVVGEVGEPGWFCRRHVRFSGSARHYELEQWLACAKDGDGREQVVFHAGCWV